MYARWIQRLFATDFPDLFQQLQAFLPAAHKDAAIATALLKEGSSNGSANANVNANVNAPSQSPATDMTFNGFTSAGMSGEELYNFLGKVIHAPSTDAKSGQEFMPQLVEIVRDMNKAGYVTPVLSKRFEVNGKVRMLKNIPRTPSLLAYELQQGLVDDCNIHRMPTFAHVRLSGCDASKRQSSWG